MRALQNLSDLYDYNTLREWMTAAVVAVVVFVVAMGLRVLSCGGSPPSRRAPRPASTTWSWS